MNSSSKFQESFRTHLSTLILAMLFILAAGYWIFSYEYKQGNFSYYFYKAHFYYARVNKIIFPFGFWVIFLIYIGSLIAFDYKSLNKSKFKHSIIMGVCLNIYLLIWTHWGEILDDFAMIPIHLPYFPGSYSYQYVMMSLSLICYYGYGWKLLFEKNKLQNPFGWQAIPMSFILPFILTPYGRSHLILLVAGVLANYIFQSSKPYSKIIPIRKNIYLPILVFLTALFFRLWYAAYFHSMGDDALGYSADGPSYFYSAVAFTEGRFEDVNYYHAPFYALYLSLLMKLFGKTSSTIYYIQAILGSLTPVLIYFISNRLFTKRIAFIAGILAAMSQIGIHHSVVSHRIDPALWILPMIILLCLSKKKQLSVLKNLGLGVLTTSLFYLAQELLPTIITLSILWFFKKVYVLTNKTEWIISIASFTLGVFLIMAPLNFIFFSHHEQLIILGREVPLDAKGKKTDPLGLNSTESQIQLKKLGFNPLIKPKESISSFFENPIKISKLIYSKAVIDAPAFLLDPGSIFFQPLILSKESILGAHLNFYLYCCILLGFIRFIYEKRISVYEKLTVIVPVIVHFLAVVLFLYGTFRHRAAISPLNIIFAVGVIGYFDTGVIKNKIHLATHDHQANREKTTSSRADTYWIRPTLLMVCLIFAIWIVIPKQQKTLPSNEKQDWLLLTKKKGVAKSHMIPINTVSFIYYKIYPQPTKPKELKEISFNICSFLTPGPRPFYRLAIDGKFIHTPKKIPHGCHEYRHPFANGYSLGIISLLVYASLDGKTKELAPVNLNLEDGNFIQIPYLLDHTVRPETYEHMKLLKKFVNDQIKISPAIIPFPVSLDP